MAVRARLVFIFLLVVSVHLLAAPPSSAQTERLCDPSWEFCYNQIVDLVRNETVGIDMAFYMIELPALVDEIIARHRAGVRVRLVVEPRGSIKFPLINHCSINCKPPACPCATNSATASST